MPEEKDVASNGLSEVLLRFVHDVEALARTLYVSMNTLSVGLKSQSDLLQKFVDKYGVPAEQEGSYLLDARYQPQASRLGRRLRQMRRGLELVPISISVSLVSAFDALIGGVLAKVFLRRPELLGGSERSLNLEQLNQLGSIEAATEYVVGKEIETVIRKSRADQFKWLEERFDLPLRKGLDSWPDFIEFTERRHCFVHNNARVSDQYLQVCRTHGVLGLDDVEKGAKLEITPEYFAAAHRCTLELGVKLGQVLWRKIFPEELVAADTNLNQISYDILADGRWGLAAILLDFGCETLKKHGSEETRRMLVINRAQAYRWQGDEEECVRIIESEDWSASGDNFVLAVAVLREDFDAAAAAMERLGERGLPEYAYQDWPLFREFRETRHFIDAYERVFGRSFEDVGRRFEAEEAQKARVLLDKLKEAGIEVVAGPDEGNEEQEEVEAN